MRGAERGCLRAGRADAQSTMGARGRVDLRDGGRGLLLGRQRRPDARGRRAGAPAARVPRGLRPGAGRVRTRRRGPAGGRGRGRLRRAALEGRPGRGAAGAARPARSPATGRQGGPRRRVGAGAAAGAAVPPGRVFCGGGARGGGGGAALIGCGAARGGRDAASGFASPSGPERRRHRGERSKPPRPPQAASKKGFKRSDACQAAFAEAWLCARGAAPRDLVLVLYGDAAFGDALGARGDLCGNHPE